MAHPLRYQQMPLVIFWREFTESNGYPPSFREAQEALGLKSLNAVAQRVARCISDGLLFRGGLRGGGRSVIVTVSGKASSRGVPVIVESKCACGASFFIPGRVKCHSCLRKGEFFISQPEFKCAGVNNGDTAEIPLTRGYRAIVDAADFELVNRYTWQVQTARGHAYAVSASCGRGKARTRMHRLLLDAKPGEVVDHISNCGLDNRRSNIRIATHAENSHNMRSSANQKKGRFKGVYLDRGKNRWRACIRIPATDVPGRSLTIGRFAHAIEAALAYDAAARLHYGRFAACNFPDES